MSCFAQMTKPRLRDEITYSGHRGWGMAGAELEPWFVRCWSRTLSVYGTPCSTPSKHAPGPPSIPQQSAPPTSPPQGAACAGRWYESSCWFPLAYTCSVLRGHHLGSGPAQDTGSVKRGILLVLKQPPASGSHMFLVQAGTSAWKSQEFIFFLKFFFFVKV